MSKKKIYAAVAMVILAVLSNILIIRFVRVTTKEAINISFCIDIKANADDYMQIYYSDSSEFSETNSSMQLYTAKDGEKSMSFALGKDKPYVRVDLGNKPLDIVLSNAYIDVYGERYEISLEAALSAQQNLNEISEVEFSEAKAYVKTTGLDSYFLFMYDTEAVDKLASDQIEKKSLIINIILCALIDLIVLACIKNMRDYLLLPLELVKEKKLIWNLAKNDFKTKYAGSYLGIIWAFVQPVVNVLVYWFVFEVGLRSGRVSEYPFILFLMSGLVPWFFFSDALNGGTTSLIEYNYLVKKVVFNISILPTVKIISSLFVHMFFVCVVGLVCVLYGYPIDMYWLQIPYYIVCTIVLVMGLTYLTSTIVCFFRDLTQIIAIFLQIGMWATPIMWQVTILPPALQTIFKLNPMYYIVEGYRNAFLAKVWFWQDMTWTLYFWIIVVLGLGIGITTFKKLRIHFADVL